MKYIYGLISIKFTDFLGFENAYFQMTKFFDIFRKFVGAPKFDKASTYLPSSKKHNTPLAVNRILLHLFEE